MLIGDTSADVEAARAKRRAGDRGGVAHGICGWPTLTSARIAYEDERAALGMDYAEAVLIIRRTMAHPNGHPIEVTELKAPANRYEIGYHRELADDPEADLTPQELADNGIDFVI
ncbi:UTRA domain-containing protein [Nonomuraea sp. NPDC004702]